MHAITKNQLLVDNVRKSLVSRGAFQDNPVTETELAGEFNVSRTPIREALKVLEKEGLIERRQRRGVYLKALTAKQISELYDVRCALESFAARLTAVNATSEDIEILMQAATGYEKALAQRDSVACRRNDLLFHSKLIDISSNELLKKMTDNFRIMEQVFTVKLSLENGRGIERQSHSHVRLVEAIKQRNPDRCEELVKSHILWRKERVIEELLGVRLSGRSTDPGE